MKRALPLFIISVWILTGCTNPSATTSLKTDGFSFAFLTDIHLKPEMNAVEGFQLAIDTINVLKPDFVLTGGDLVMDVLDQTYGRADSVYNLYKKVSGGLDMPVYNTIGNHEIYGWHRQEEGIEDHPEFGKGMYEKRIGARYSSFDHKGWHFILLDGMCRSEGGHYYGKIDDEQVQWLKDELQKIPKETPIIISTHIPFITSLTQLTKGALEATPAYLILENSREVLLLFREHINVNNQVHFITGGAVSGKWWNNAPDEPVQEGFLMIHVADQDFTWEYVDYGWTPPWQ